MGQHCMTKEELDNRDLFGAFADFYSVKAARDKGILPKDYWDCVPETCTCGAEILISRNLIHIMCCDPRCYVKLGYNLEKVYRNFNVVGIGPATCLEISKQCSERTRYYSHLEFLNYEYFDLPFSLYGVKGQDISETNKRIRGEIMPFALAVSKMGIPSWGNEALKYLGQYDDCVQWMDDVIRYPSWIEYFDQKLRVYDQMKRFYLREYSRDIIYACSEVFDKYSLKAFKEIPITLSGSLNVNGRRFTKAAYIDILNKMSPISNGRRVIQFVNNNAVASNAYVISDEMHTKARVAKQREMVTGKKILYGSAEFLEFVKKNFEGKVGETSE